VVDFEVIWRAQEDSLEELRTAADADFMNDED